MLRPIQKPTNAARQGVTGHNVRYVLAVSLGAAEQPPRAWRMRISVMKVGNEVKISNVRFVS